MGIPKKEGNKGIPWNLVEGLPEPDFENSPALMYGIPRIRRSYPGYATQMVTWCSVAVIVTIDMPRKWRRGAEAVSAYSPFNANYD